MDAQELRNLQEAYLEVVSNDLNEMSYKKLPVGKMMWKVSDRAEREADTRAERERQADDPHSTLTYDRARAEHEKAERNKERSNKMIRVADTHSKKAAKAKSKLKKEEVDIYDIILSHLLDEGYAETQGAAEAIMVNMSEEWRESIMIAEGMTMKDFKANRKKARASAARADAVKRGHVGKEWYNSGRRYSPDEAKRMRSKLDDEERRTRHRSAVEPDNENDDDFSADKTKNPKKLRKQKAMGEH